MSDNKEQANHLEAFAQLPVSHGNAQTLLAKMNFVGIFALLASIPFSMIPFTLAFIFPRPTVSQAFYFQLSVINLAILIAVLHVILRVPVRAFRHPVCIPALLFGFFCLFSCLFSRSPLYSLRESLFPLSCIIFFLLAANLKFTAYHLSKVIWILLGIGVLLSIYGILQYYGIDIQLATRRGELGYVEEQKIGKFAVLSLAGHPNFLSAYLGPILLMGVALVFTTTRRLTRIAAIGALAILAYCIFLAGARGSWVGLFVVGLFLGVGGILRGAAAKRVKVLLACLGAAFILLMLLFSVPNPIVTPRYNVLTRVTDKQALLSRAYGYHVAVKMLGANMLTGTGFRSFTDTFWDTAADLQADPENVIYRDILVFIEGTPPGYIHNEYLEIATGIGLGGIASFFLILAVFFCASLRRLKQINKHNSDLLYPFLIGGVMFYAIVSLPSFPLDLPLSGPLFWFLLAVGIPGTSGEAGFATEKQIVGSRIRSWRLPIALMIAGIVLFYGVCFLAIPPVSRAMAKSYYKSVEASQAQTQSSLEGKIRESPTNMKAYYDLLQIYINEKNTEAADNLYQRFIESLYHQERYGYWIGHFFFEYTLFKLSLGDCEDPDMLLSLAHDYGVTVEEMLEEVWARADYKSSVAVQSALLSFIFSEGHQQLALEIRRKLIEEDTFTASDFPSETPIQSQRFGEISAEYRLAKDSLARIGTPHDWKVVEGIGRNETLYSKGIISMTLTEAIPAGSSLWIWIQGTPVINVHPLVEITVGNQSTFCYVRGGKPAPYMVWIEQSLPSGQELRIRFLNDTVLSESDEDRNLSCGDVFVGKQDL